MNQIFKSLSITLLTLSAGSIAQGKAVDESTAKNVGCNFLLQRNVQGVKSVSDLVTSYVATDAVGGKAVNDFYVFNINGGDGFVMVSGDDQVIPVLAYSTESSFDFAKISPSAKAWINGYQNQITAVIANKLEASKIITNQWSDLKSAKRSAAAKTTAVTPLLTTKWDQEPGYNMYCPTGTPTGCVATAMAQIMKFWNWPTKGCGYHTYTPTTVPSYGPLSADMGNTAYDWATMGTHLTSSCAATARLMSHIGISVNMDYTTLASGSGAYTTIAESPILNCAEWAFKTYWHYKRSVHGMERNIGMPDEVPTATWISTLQSELNAGRPMLYSGAGSDGGHAWVCDGWEVASNMFHFNWGWSGTGPDGYYTVDNIAPPVLGTGGGGSGNNFNSYQAVIMGIQPDSFASSTGTLRMLSQVDCQSNSPMPYVPSSFSVIAKVQNNGSATFHGDFCAQVFDTSLNLLYTMATLPSQTVNAGDSTIFMTFANTATLYKMIPGQYKIRIMYRATGTTAWTAVANNGVFINENVLAVGNSQSMELASAIAITGSPAYLTPSTAVTLNSSIQNNSASSFNGSISAVLTNVATGTTYTIQTLTGQMIFSTFTNPYTFSTGSLSAPTGTYTLSIQHQPGGSGSFILTGSDHYENPVIVKVGNPAGLINQSLDEKVNVYPNPATDYVNIELKDVNATEAWITDIQGRMVKQVSLTANQAITQVPVNGIAPGFYFMNIRVGSDIVSRKLVIR